MFAHELSFVASVTSLALLTSCVGQSDAARLESGKHVSRSRRQLATTANTVELLLVLDKQAYDKYLARNNNDAALARQEIERYFAGVVKETNERFTKLDNGGFSLRVSLTSILTLTTIAESSATESNRIGNTVNSRNALIDFRTQAQGLEPTNRHDYAVLVTGYDLKREDGSDTDVRTFGGGVCSDQKRGVIENFCTERTSLALTRVISLALNAKYDAVGNLCNDVEFVMSPVSEIPTASQRENPFTFSACSANEIRQYLSNEINTRCLRSQDVANPLNIDTLTTTELGQQYSADVQCTLRLGTGSTLCRSLYATLNYDATLCHDMRCSVPGSSNCQGILPFDGTTCGNQKWCQDGICTFSASAPAIRASATCPQGDAPPATGFSCSASACASATPSYRDFTCCQTCGDIPAATTPPVPVTQGVTNPPTMPNNPVPTTVKMVSVVGVTPAATTAKMVSVAGATPAATTVATPAATTMPNVPVPTTAPMVSVGGVTPAATTMPMDLAPTTAPMVSVVGVTPAATTMPMDLAPTTAPMVSVVGVTPAATTMPMDLAPTTAPMVSVVGVTPAATNVPMSTAGVTAATTIGPTMSIEGVTGGMPNNPVPTTTSDPTMSIEGVTGGMPNNPPPTTTPLVTISVPVVPNIVGQV